MEHCNMRLSICVINTVLFGFISNGLSCKKLYDTQNWIDSVYYVCILLCVINIIFCFTDVIFNIFTTTGF